jgi:two-component system sensor histidine kinase/response regulator
MKTCEYHRLPPKDLYRKPDRILPGLVETLEIPEGMLQDVIYDLQRTQEQLSERVTALQVRNKELEASAHMIAHDLKDSLAVLVLSSNLITDIPDLTPQELDESLQQIKSTAYNMNRIINSLLLFAEVSKAEAPVEPVDMTRVVANVRDRLSHMIKERQAQINLPEAWPDAIGYAPWIEEVWANYISNALKHGGQPPCVDLGASTQSDGMVCFWTRDNGPGLPPEARRRLFIPFGQISRLRTLGHGVGLSIVLHIVEKLGGRVGVESELGKGSLFFFTLPASPSSD